MRIKWDRGCRAPGKCQCSAKADSCHSPPGHSPSLSVSFDWTVPLISQNCSFLLTLDSIHIVAVFLQLPNRDCSSFCASCCFVTLGSRLGFWWTRVAILGKPRHFGSWLFLIFEETLNAFVTFYFAIWCLVWLHLCLLNDFRRRPSLHMGRRRRLCWFLPYVHLFVYYDFCNLTSTDPLRQSLYCSLETHFFVCSAGSCRENIFFMPITFSLAKDGCKINVLSEQRGLIWFGWFFGQSQETWGHL